MRSSIQNIVVSVSLILALVALPVTANASRPSDLIFLHYWTGSLSGGIQEMSKAFNRANPEYRVRATGFEHESFKIGINVMLAGGSPPDMFSYWAGAKVNALVNKDYLAPIDQAWSKANLDTVFPASVSKACTYQGHKYALPLTQHYAPFFYNKKIFTQHSITPPTDWKSFLAACETLKQAGVTPIALGARDKWPAQFWFDYILLRTAGPQFRQQLMNGEASYNSPEVHKVFALWAELLEAGYFNDNPTHMDWSEAAKLVHSGEAAMTLMGTWAIGLFDNQLGWKQETDYDFFPFPVINPDVELTSVGPIDVIVVSREGKSDQVNAVLGYFSDPGPQMEMSRGSGALSPSKAIPPSFYSPMQSRILTTIRQTPHWAFNYDLATPPEVAEYGLDAFKAFMLMHREYTDILTTLSEQADAYFNQHKQ